jgi:hypothetical protein
MMLASSISQSMEPASGTATGPAAIFYYSCLYCYGCKAVIAALHPKSLKRGIVVALSTVIKS